MAISGPGRPRHSPAKRPGETTREQILDAGAELFTTAGFASTSTRQIADAVGIRQASLYHHFATKEEILDALLGATMRPALIFADALDALVPGPGPQVRLHALARFDADQLLHSRWNTGALYLLPEVQSSTLQGFRTDRASLFERYRTLSQDVLDAAGGPPGAEALAFHLVESIVTHRNDRFPGVPLDDLVLLIADSCLRVLGWDGTAPEWAQVQAASGAVVTSLAGNG